jgi:hypothetical protein
MPCLINEIALSLVPLLFVTWAVTGMAFQVRRALLAGMSAGAVGLLALHLHCPNGLPSHLFIFHALPWVGLSALAIAARAKLPSRTFAP